MRRTAPRLLALLTALAALGSPPAHAESLRLRSGRSVEVASVRVEADRLDATVVRDGVASRVAFPFSSLDPTEVLRFLDADAPGDGRARLRSARFALAQGQREGAAMRFLQAAALDPTLAPQRDAGLAQIRRAEAVDGVDDLEGRVRRGVDPRGAALLAAAILDSVHAAELTVAERRRVEVLGALARKLLQRETERRLLAEAKLAATEKAPAPPAAPVAPAVPEGAASDDEDPVVADALAPLRAKQAKAAHARERAADPALGVEEAARHLEVAARELLDARRVGRALHPADLDEEQVHELESRGIELRTLLLGTYLELADLYRQMTYFEEARARVRAVLILDPGNEEAWAQRRLIEDDIRVFLDPPVEALPLQGGVSFGWYRASPFFGGYGPCLRAVPLAYGGVRFGYRAVRPVRAPAVRRVSGIRR